MPQDDGRDDASGGEGDEAEEHSERTTCAGGQQPLLQAARLSGVGQGPDMPRIPPPPQPLQPSRL